MSSEYSESEIINGCLQGDPVAQRLLYRRYAAKMLGVCRRYAKNIEDAEDILQEGFLTVFTKISQFSHKGSFEGWVRRIMVSRAIESCRKEMRIFPVTDIEDLAEKLPSTDDVLATLSVKDLLAFIDELPTMHRIVFNLYIFENMDHNEIAEKLTIPVGTSKSTLYYARLTLRRKINQSMLVAQKNESRERKFS